MRNQTTMLIALWIVGVGNALGQDWPVAGFPPAMGHSAGAPAQYTTTVIQPPMAEPRAATVGESQARGMAAMLNAQAQAALLFSAARLNAAEACQREIENRREWVSALFTLREQNRAARFGQRHAQTARAEPRTAPVPAAPARPLVGLIRGADGAVRWPYALEGDQFAEHRCAVERLLAESAQNGGLRAADHRNLATAVLGMRQQLKADIRQFCALDYVSAKRFLDRLTFEVLGPPEHLAAR